MTWLSFLRVFKIDKDSKTWSFGKGGSFNLIRLWYLETGGLKDTSLGEKFIENVIGYFQIPLGVATNFRIDDRDFIIPMAVEETSIVAAASKTAKWVREIASGRAL